MPAVLCSLRLSIKTLTEGARLGIKGHAAVFLFAAFLIAYSKQ
jgi:Na+-transporting methylmalonyl-CoA/oxaloacetate decarboxylase gamma subunit